MATVSITIPDGELNRITEAFAGYYGYQETVPDPPGDPIPNPETKAQFLRARVIDYIRETVHVQELTTAVAAAESTVVDVNGIE